jgi:hypothetical protein
MIFVSVAPPETAESVKIVLGVLAGVVTGVVTGVLSTVMVEPLRNRLKRRDDTARARKAIYAELNALYSAFRTTVETFDDSKAAECFANHTTEVFDFYFDKNREACYDIPEWAAIHHVYRMYKDLRTKAMNTAQPGGLVPIPAARKVVETFEDGFTWKLDKSMFTKLRLS